MGVLDYFSAEKRKARLEAQLDKEKKRADTAEELGQLRAKVASERARSSKYSQTRQFAQNVSRGAGRFAGGLKTTVTGISSVAQDLGGRYDKKPSKRDNVPYFEHTLFGSPLPAPKKKPSKRRKKSSKGSKRRSKKRR